MKVQKIKIPDEVTAVLEAAHVDGNTLKITQQLPRDLYVKVNKVLEALGGKWNRKFGGHIFSDYPREIIRQALEDGELVDEKKTYQDFQTPPELAKRMVTLANLNDGDRILEPSVGGGRLLDVIVSSCTYSGLVLVEINSKYVEQLVTRGYEVRNGDFLDMNSSTLGMFDKIIMNPPFTGSQDIAHIMHARELLRPGGLLVAICAGGTKQREKLKPIVDTWEELPKDTFKESGTGVHTALLTIRGK